MTTQLACVIVVGLVCLTIVLCHLLEAGKSNWAQISTNRLLRKILDAIEKDKQ